MRSLAEAGPFYLPLLLRSGWRVRTERDAGMLFRSGCGAILVSRLDINGGFITQFSQVLAHRRAGLGFKIILLYVVFNVFLLRNAARYVLQNLQDDVSLLREDWICHLSGLQ